MRHFYSNYALNHRFISLWRVSRKSSLVSVQRLSDEIPSALTERVTEFSERGVNCSDVIKELPRSDEISVE